MEDVLCAFNIYFICVEMVWVCTDYASLRVHVFGNDETFKNFGKESLILTSSHRGDLDWVAGFVLGAHYRFLHVSSTALAFVLEYKVCTA